MYLGDKKSLVVFIDARCHLRQGGEEVSEKHNADRIRRTADAFSVGGDAVREVPRISADVSHPQRGEAKLDDGWQDEGRRVEKWSA